MIDSFGFPGYLVIAVYLIATVVLGISFARNQRNVEDYFLASRAMPWWAVGISVIACDLSAISYMGSPAWTYYHDLRYVITIFMVPIIAVIVAHLFIPFLASMKVYTIYEYLEHRFGLSSRLFASAVFLLQRAAHIAIAVYAVALALQQIVGWSVVACVATIGGLTTLYTVVGGMKAVLWTDVMQFFVLLVSMLLMAGIVLWSFDGNASLIWQIANDAGHTKMFSFPLDFTSPGFWLEMSFWGILIGTFISQTGVYGSDQVLVQRYLSAGSGRLMARALVFSAILQIPVAATLYLLGLGFFAYYHAPENTHLLASLNALIERTGDPNMILPHFVRNVLPSSLAGLVFAGLFASTMSVFSSGLNSLSTVTCVDFISRLKRQSSADSDVTVDSARGITAVWGIVITGAAIGVYFAHMGSLLETAVAIIGFFSGPILGMFLLGMFSLRATGIGSIVGASCGFIFALVLSNRVSFVWYPAIGFTPTIILGFIFSYLTPAYAFSKIYPLTIWGRQKNTQMQENKNISVLNLHSAK